MEFFERVITGQMEKNGITGSLAAREMEKNGFGLRRRPRHTFLPHIPDRYAL
jgi:hypothetical protein